MLRWSQASLGLRTDDSENIPRSVVNFLGQLREGPGPWGGLFYDFFSPHYSRKWVAFTPFSRRGSETTSEFWTAQLANPVQYSAPPAVCHTHVGRRTDFLSKCTFPISVFNHFTGLTWSVQCWPHTEPCTIDLGLYVCVWSWGEDRSY